MNPFFDQLGRKVRERWQQENFSLEAFPEIATTAIDESPPSGAVDLEEMIHEFLINEEQPFQSESGFGQPELIAYNHPRFYIQILFWLEGTTDVHQHEFSGAFHVMSGSSIHAEYEFEKEQVVTPYLSVGDLRMKQIELLETGRTVPITSGRGCIHSLFHLDTPSVTVVVRTHNDPGTGPQYNYLPPHLAVDPIQVGSDTLTMRRKQLLGVLESLGDPNYATRVSEMVASLDFERGFSILLHAMDYLQEFGEWETVLGVFEEKHGDLAKGVAKTLEESSRRDVITRMRGYIEDPEHRFFLALLMNVPNRLEIYSLISKRFANPPRVVLQWLGELIEPTDFGIAILDATFPETLDLPAQEQADMLMATLEHFLDGSGAVDELSEEQSEIYGALKASSLGVLFD
ncbi:hypothetical protein VSU19_04210 [Verrucomicrobiales bacterium BCK34]|nr:hypothetical protein [Verrucomicrobiales bacterium BCK34]